MVSRSDLHTEPSILQFGYSKGELEAEALRLYEKLKNVGWNLEACKEIAPLTLEINKLKKELGVVILAHSYQTADIIFGVADFVGDSLGLAKKATELKTKRILFCGVDFMAETCKILNPEKTIIVPGKNRGCTLADAITAEDVRKLKKQYPGVPVVCYVNTTAEVKAECDVCCTSANAKRIIEKLDSDTIIFVPDKNMGENLAKLTGKKIITWEGYCRTHNRATQKLFEEYLKDEDVIVLSHLECKKEIVDNSNIVGGTGDMERFAKKAPTNKKILYITEQGFIDRMKGEHPELKFVDSNLICPMMKQNTLETILEALLNIDNEEHVIELPKEIIIKAQNAVNEMLKY